ncbi:glycoside hydrolase family 2 protein [Lewinella cohaerens]|uniref:glycoside hydrolase family 2 protein n=1 Tax=Lewinella cohaerens TaxID=70995 RepID=UPI0003824AD8|nr:glycoside hydrolase family 2 [Lewinella cohaerens]
MSKQFLLLALMICVSSSYGQDHLLQNVYNRTTISLNGDWKYIVDPYENGYYNYRYEPFDQQPTPWASAFFLNSKPKDASDLLEYDFDKMDNLKVPGDWNTQKESLYYYEGTVWYKQSFDFDFSAEGNRLFVYFEAANYQAEVYLNGSKLGTHTGGFTPFNFEVTDIVKAQDNFLIVKIDNKRLKDGVPTLNTDWWNYGGITRDVKLVETAATFVADYFIQLDPQDTKKIKGYVQVNSKDTGAQKLQLKLPGLGIDQQLTSDQDGYAAVDLSVEDIRYWSLDDPFLYDVAIETAQETVKDQIGFRSIRTEGTQIMLNDQPVYLKGISIHEESPLRDGRGYSKEDATQLLEWAKELGCNYVRLAHYPHNEHMVRLADQMGILVWEENPVYWTISWDNESTYQNAETQLSELIARDKNRASVIIWSMANETPNVPARNVFLNKLAAYARAKDNTRLISAALEQKNYQGDPTIRTIDDPFAEVVDILSFNQYIGWYDGLPEKCKTITWKIEEDKPVLISEFGAGAKQGLHGSKEERWTEEFQENLYVETLQMIDKIDKIQGFSPWILVDFRSPRRVLPEIQDGWNRKGLISEEGEKKKAFFILQAFYNNK